MNMPSKKYKKIHRIKRLIIQKIILFCRPLRSNNPFNTHIPVIVSLLNLLKLSNIKLLELGSGEYSTIQLFSDPDFNLYHVDVFEDDFDFFRQLKTKVSNHINYRYVEKINVFLENYLATNKYDVIFIDNSMNYRIRQKTIELILNYGFEYLIIHDYEFYGYRKVVKNHGENLFLTEFKMFNPSTAIITKNKKSYKLSRKIYKKINRIKLKYNYDKEFWKYI